MTPEFLSAVVDTLLPGDNGAPPLPTGTIAGVANTLETSVARAASAPPHQVALEAIASAAGGEEAFVRDVAQRIASVRRVEAELPGPFQALVARALQDYYEADVVLQAMGWRPEPPQPEGHTLPAFDEALLEPVRQRGRMWR